MKSVIVAGPNENSWTEIAEPECGPRDVLLRIRACGICGSDAMYSAVGGIPPRQGATPLGHEPAAEVIEVGSEVEADAIAVGDHVVIDTMAFTDGLLGSGGAQGALTPIVVVRDFVPNTQLRVIPKEIPWHVAALNEPMAVAHHAVNRSGAGEGDNAVVFGAGPIGLGAVLSLKAKGVAHVIVVDIQPQRLEVALAVGADAVINSAELPEGQTVTDALIAHHGEARNGLGRGRYSGTDVYLDAAGAPQVIASILASAKHRAVVTIPAVHKRPVEFDLGELLQQELDIRLSMGYPTEIFEVTDAIIASPEKYAKIISHTFPFTDALEALELAKTPGAADKVVVVFD
jgi:threonine dehydrogenase-like Zn-dependent dehydrogenase